MAVTRLLSAWQSGDANALEQLLPLLYEHLRAKARSLMKNERSNHTLQATAVVHEAFVKLGEVNVPWKDRTHFLMSAARAMRQILVDHAKSRRRIKRGGLLTVTTPVEELPADQLSADHMAREIDVLEVDEALRRLAAHSERLAQIVELHYFGGLSYLELAETLKVSEATIDRDLRLAKAWILKQIRPSRNRGPQGI